MGRHEAPLINAPGGGYRIPEYRETEAPGSLARAAEVVWFFTRPLRGRGHGPHTILPETGFSLSFTGVRGRGGSLEDARLELVGPIRTARRWDPPAGMRMVAVRLKPEWAAGAFGVDPGELLDEVVDARSSGWPGADALLDRLVRVKTPEQAARLLAASVEARWSGSSPARGARLAHLALERIRSGGMESASVSATARELGVTSRHLRRVIDGAAGVAPKFFHRVRRLHRAASLATAPAAPHWSTLALEAGFYDQAHMIRDFRDLAGLTPTELRRARTPASPRTT